MPRVVFQNVWANINKSGQFNSPRKITDLNKWYSAAKNVIPEIPLKDGTEGWYLFQEYIDPKGKWIKWELHNALDERCYIVIDRKYDAVGNVSTP